MPFRVTRNHRTIAVSFFLILIAISYQSTGYIWGTKYTVTGTEGLLWPARFIGFGVGVIIYAIMVSWLFGEGLSTKTIISLLISIALISIQVFWKN